MSLINDDLSVYLATGWDTGELAADALRRWWYRLGRQSYAGVGGMLILADCGGSNGYKVALYREQLSNLAARIQIPIRVADLPPYCSKYNPIDHRLFCHLTRALRGRSCESLQWMQLLFSRVTTQAGLSAVAELALMTYETGAKASNALRRAETSCWANTTTSSRSANDEVISEQFLSIRSSKDIAPRFTPSGVT